MPRNDSIQYAMIKKALSDITNDNTSKAYKADIKEFARWAREQKYKSVEDIKNAGAKRIVQMYRDDVVLKKTKSPSTEHRKIAAICKGLGIRRPRSHEDPEWHNRIVTRKRTSDKIVRGRNIEKNAQGRREEFQTRFKRLVDFQNATGLRRAEIGRLRGKDLVRDESGHMCVYVERGKGGKKQLQRILPNDIDFIISIFNSVPPDKKIFSRKELNNHINLHAMRAHHAKKAYNYYVDICKEKEKRDILIAELAKRFLTSHDNNLGKKAFLNELKKCKAGEQYILRGANKKKAISLGLPIVYDRLSVLAVSVFHLSHWRLDVTVTNYLIQ